MQSRALLAVGVVLVVAWAAPGSDAGTPTGGTEGRDTLADLRGRTAAALSLATRVTIELPKDAGERATAFADTVKRWKKWLDDEKRP